MYFLHSLFPPATDWFRDAAVAIEGLLTFPTEPAPSDPSGNMAAFSKGNYKTVKSLKAVGQNITPYNLPKNRQSVETDWSWVF